MILNRRLYPLYLMIFSLLLSCGQKDSNRVPEPKEGEFLSCSITGTVQGRSKKNRSWTALEAGALLKDGQEIRTGEEGEIYLRSGKNILLRLGPRSEATFHYSGKKEITTLLVTRGNLTLENPGTELQVRLPHMALYSQEGFFSLKADEETVEVYNREGELRLLPGMGEPERLTEIIREDEREWGESLADDQRPVFPGETWYLDDETLRQQGKIYEQLILDFDGLEPDRIDLEEPIQDILSMEITISEYNRNSYDKTLAAFDLFRKEGNRPRYRLSLQSDSGTEIKTNYNSGKELIHVILREDQNLDVEIGKAGYQTVKAQVNVETVSAFTQKLYYKLPRLTSRTIAIEVNPPESEITINGIYAGKGNIVLDVKPDEPLEVNFTLEGYNEQYLYLDAEQERPDTIRLELKKTVEKVVKGAYQEVIGLAARGDDIYISDWSGIVWFLHEPSGWRRFNNRTSNYPNNYSAPVVTDNYLYFSGKRYLVIMNRLSGAILSKTRLNDRENHLNGQHPVPMDYQLLFPTKDSIRFLTGDGKKIREVFIPGGSFMTPALYNGRIYTAATDGQIYEISSTGQILRSLATGLETPMGQSIVFDSGRGYLCDSQGQVAAFSPSSMSLEWVSEPHEEKRNFIRDVLLTEDRVYYYGGVTLFALDRNTGKKLPPLAPSIQTYPLLQGPFIYAMTDDERMTVFSAETGRAVKEIDLGYEVTSPIYFFDGRIMAGAFDGNILILNQLDPSLLSKPIK
ncbi:MAG: PQQ-binding-like beta-propeller repeat protein [Spirochaetales bacterium]|nr:PQQ-binding-like beta-propeller repeat protein [Spirochaetales bacterium]